MSIQKDLYDIWCGWLIAPADTKMLFASALVDYRANSPYVKDNDWDSFAHGLPGYEEIAQAHMLRLALRIVSGL